MSIETETPSATPVRAGGSLGDLRRLTWAGADLAKASFDGEQ